MILAFLLAASAFGQSVPNSSDMGYRLENLEVQMKSLTNGKIRVSTPSVLGIQWQDGSISTSAIGGPQGPVGPAGADGAAGPAGPTLGIYDSLGLTSSGGRSAGDAGARAMYNLGQTLVGEGSAVRSDSSFEIFSSANNLSLLTIAFGGTPIVGTTESAITFYQKNASNVQTQLGSIEALWGDTNTTDGFAALGAHSDYYEGGVLKAKDGWNIVGNKGMTFMMPTVTGRTTGAGDPQGALFYDSFLLIGRGTVIPGYALQIGGSSTGLTEYSRGVQIDLLKASGDVFGVSSNANGATTGTNYAIYSNATNASTNNYSFYGVAGKMYNAGPLLLGGAILSGDSSSSFTIPASTLTINGGDNSNWSIATSSGIHSAKDIKADGKICDSMGCIPNIATLAASGANSDITKLNALRDISTELTLESSATVKGANGIAASTGTFSLVKATATGNGNWSVIASSGILSLGDVCNSGGQCLSNRASNAGAGQVWLSTASSLAADYSTTDNTYRVCYDTVSASTGAGTVRIWSSCVAYNAQAGVNYGISFWFDQTYVKGSPLMISAYASYTPLPMSATISVSAGTHKLCAAPVSGNGTNATVLAGTGATKNLGCQWGFDYIQP